MAAPESVNLRNLSGRWVMNKDLSGDTDSVLAMQGMSWFIRKAVSYSAVTLNIKQYTDEEGAIHIDVEQVSTGGFKNNEERKIDWTWREKKDNMFGLVRGRSRFCKLDEIEQLFLKDGWDDKSIQESGGEVINAFVESLDTSGDQWTADQIWGFEMINGERRHARHIICKRGEQTIQIRTVYDWKPEEEEERWD